MKALPCAALEPFEPRLLEGRVVIIVEIVDADDLLAAVEQRHGDGRSDEAGDAGDEQGHARLLADARSAARGALHGRYGS